MQARIGAGGMGEVYRARDTRLGRDVAIKVLPGAFMSDPDRLARFEREARVLAAVSHPNIGAIYGFEEADGIRALVLELVEGETLADRIARGPLRFADALAIARQIADALDVAHEKGIVHRDLKPANIKIAPGGTVKVLDFGLATTEPLAAAHRDLSQSPTVTADRTREGLVMGTAGYMSPEQARGAATDRRTDIWAFGCVLYEMLAGRRAFGGTTVADVLAAILERQPDWQALPAATSPEVRRLLRSCLEKDPQRRLRDIGDVRLILDSGEDVRPPGAARPMSGIWGWLAATAAGVAAAWLWLATPPVEQPLRISSLLAPQGSLYNFTSPGSFIAGPVLSPDGTRIVFGARSPDGKATQLWVRALDSPVAQPLPGTETAAFPFWSPDSRYVGFSSNVDRVLKKVDVLGGPPVPITQLTQPFQGASWSADGVIVFCQIGQVPGPSSESPLLKVAHTGGEVSRATAIEEGGRAHRFPWFLPDGRHFLYLGVRSTRSIVFVGSIDDASAPGKAVGESDSNVIYADGHLLYLRVDTLMAQPFDVRRLETTGEAVAIAERIPAYLQPLRAALFSAATSGLLVHAGGAPDEAGARLVWKDRAGTELAVLDETAGRVVELHLSPDRKQLLASLMDRNNIDLWTYDLNTQRKTRFTFDSGAEPYAVWSADGKTIIWRNGPGVLFSKAANGTGTDQQLFPTTNLSPRSVSPDGSSLLYVRGGADIWSLPLTPARPGEPLTPRPVVVTSAGEDHPQFSPDGKWVAYTSDETRSREAYVIPYTGQGTKRQVSSGGAALVRWRSDGRELFYVTTEGDLMAAEIVTRGDTVEVGRTQQLFGGISPAQGYVYDVSLDGQQFIVAQAAPGTPSTAALTLVENWRRLVERAGEN